MGIELEAVRIFLAIVRHQDFGDAGKEFGHTQGWASSRLTAFEMELGAPLIRRRRGPHAGDRMQLTEAGRALHARGMQIVSDLEETERIVKAGAALKRGRLRVAHSASHREPIVHTVAAILASDMHITVEELSTPRIEKRIRDGSLDLGLVHSWTRLEDLGHMPLEDAPLRLIVHPRHPIALSRSSAIIDLKDLAAEQFVLTRKGRLSRRVVDAYFHKHNDFAPRIAVEANALATVLALVRSTTRVVTILPVPAPYQRDLRGLPMIDLPKPGEHQSTYLLWRGARTREPRSEAARLFARVLRDYLAGRRPEPE